MSPTTYLLAMIALSIAGGLGQAVVVLRRREALRRLAGQWQLHYSPRDHFGLAEQIADRFPVPGAAALRARDLLYRSSGSAHRYIFTVEYTVGVVHTKKRKRCVVSLSEPDGDAPVHLSLADAQGPLIDQYRQLCATEL